jgi:hypothetical protein
MAKKETKEVTTRPTNAAQTYEEGSWGSEDVSSEDILVPKIMLMQPMSEFVTDGLAKIGEFRDSLNKERMLGNDKKPVELLVFGTFKTLLEFKDGEYLSTKRWSPEVADLPMEEVTADGAVVTRDKVLNFYCLIADDIKGGEAFPFVLSCRRTSFMAGKKINTHLTKLKMFKKSSAAKVFALTSRKETNDKGTFFVVDVDVLRDSTTEELNAAFEWYQLLGKSRVKVDDSDIKARSSHAATSDTEEAHQVQ